MTKQQLKKEIKFMVKRLFDIHNKEYSSIEEETNDILNNLSNCLKINNIKKIFTCIKEETNETHKETLIKTFHIDYELFIEFKNNYSLLIKDVFVVIE